MRSFFRERAKKIIYFSILFVSVFLVRIYHAYSTYPDEILVLVYNQYVEFYEITGYYMDMRKIIKNI